MGLARRSLPLVVAVASIAFGVATVWPELGRQHDRYAALTPQQVVYAGALHEHLDAARLGRWRSEVGPHDRWLAPGADFVTRTFATYLLLPAVPARTRADATVVLR